MARNDSHDRDVERRLQEHFTAEGGDLRAPEDLWERLEGRLGEQIGPRFALLRDRSTGTGGRAWPQAAAAAAVMVVVVGVAASGIADGLDDRGNERSVETLVLTEGAIDPDDVEALREAYSVPSVGGAVADRRERRNNLTEAYAPFADPTAAPAAGGAVAERRQPEPPPQSRATAAPALVAPPQPQATAAPALAAPPQPQATAAPALVGPRQQQPAATPALVATPQQQPADTTFQNYGRTPLVDTSVDAVSTFSLDADRTSYYVALAWARDGYAVEPDSVRAEEWINAFNYGYETPTHGRAFAITSAVVRHPFDSERYLARIAFQAADLRDDTPLNVTLVLDASGSMDEGDRVAIAREAAETIRRSLSSRDRIAVVHFTTNVIDALTVEHREPDHEDVASSIRNLVPHASTNVQAGLNLGVQLASEARLERPDARNYIILMSDGVANVDATNPFAILESARDSDGTNPLRLITVGVGIENYNDYLLEQLAQHGNGWYRYLGDTDQARATFSRENWLALSVPVADQTRAQVTWDPAVVKTWRIVGYENRVTSDHTFEQNRTEFAEIHSGAATTVFYELELQEGIGGGLVSLGGMELRWVDPASGASLSQRVGVSGRADIGFASGNSALRFGAIVALASDRYSRLSRQHENAAIDAPGVQSSLSALRGELRLLEEHYGSTEAFRDFRFLLDALTTSARELAPPSGYSR